MATFPLSFLGILAAKAVLERASWSYDALASCGRPCQTSLARRVKRIGIFEDCGVAGLWRLAHHLEQINDHDAVIVVAGMEGALASVVGGLCPRPIFAVPTSIGYGVSSGGKAALDGMLASCAPGISCLNIDNGYGAACAAARVVNLL